MGTLHQMRTALSRYHRSKGFGIHSPFAFNFVLDVLRSRYPYYAYDELLALRDEVKERSSSFWRHPRMISEKNAKLIFRVTNYFNPSEILQIGTSYGVSTASMLMVSSKSKLTLLASLPYKYPITKEVLGRYAKRITQISDTETAINCYETACHGTNRFVLVNDIADEKQYLKVKEYVLSIIDSMGTVVMRNIGHSPLMKRLWEECVHHGSHGMAFSNERLAVFVANPKLPRQEFLLWF